MRRELKLIATLLAMSNGAAMAQSNVMISGSLDAMASAPSQLLTASATNVGVGQIAARPMPTVAVPTDNASGRLNPWRSA